MAKSCLGIDIGKDQLKLVLMKGETIQIFNYGNCKRDFTYIDDIVTGVQKADGEYVTIIDRAEAIRYAIENAKEGDVIVLAGKGHEDYQEIKGKKHHMDERELVADVVRDGNFIK